MAVGARLRSKAASSFPRRKPRRRGRREGDEEAAAILEHLECGDEDAVDEASGAQSSRRVHLAFLPERYEPLEEQAPREKPPKKFRQKLKKYGKNVGKVVTKGCHYMFLGLQGFAAAYSAPFGVVTSMMSSVH
ncbi:required for drug-induced death protein 1 [Tenrec ecaudatus]|uniref:required for drug-induced death protein 1 n=1 Tax=Tenrec ecaudatus TaxID=94439 RepID=UPI003F599C2D